MGANRRYGDPLTALDDPAVQTRSEPGVRHVWVNLSTSKNHPAEYAGLIVAWRKGIHGWEAQVAHVTDIESPSLHISWVDARRLRPAT